MNDHETSSERDSKEGAKSERGLRRRDVLIAGAGMGLATVVPASSETDGLPVPAGATQSLMDEVGLLSRALRAEPESTPSCNWTPVDQELSARDRATEIALARLWMAFARGASLHTLIAVTSDVTYEALLAGRSYFRTTLDDEAASGSIDEKFLTPHIEKWEAMGEFAAWQSEFDPIGKWALDKAWEGSYGLPVAKPDLASLRDRAVELVGDMCWFRWQVGALSGPDRDVDENAVIDMGRKYSRRPIWNRVKDWGLYKSDADPLDPSKWGEFTKVGVCAFLAGRRSARWAKRQSDGIKASHFDQGWCEVKTKLQVLFSAKGKDLAPYSGACGG